MSPTSHRCTAGCESFTVNQPASWCHSGNRESTLPASLMRPEMWERCQVTWSREPVQRSLLPVRQARKRRYHPLVMGGDRDGGTDCTMRPKTHGRYIDQPPASGGQGHHQQQVAGGNPRPIGAMHSIHQNPAARWPTPSRPEWFLSREVSGSLTDQREAYPLHSPLPLATRPPKRRWDWYMANMAAQGRTVQAELAVTQCTHLEHFV